MDPDLFAAASEQIGPGRAPHTDRRPATKHTYVLRGRLCCATCARKMSGDSSGGSARYRCRFTTNEYTRNLELDITHPKSAAVAERRCTRVIDGWLERLFDADNTADDIAELATWFADNIDQFRSAMNDADPAARQALCDALNIVGRYTPGTSRPELAHGPTSGTVVRIGGGLLTKRRTSPWKPGLQRR